MKREAVIIAYDIAHPGRLRRLHRYLSKRARALQYSVFVAELSPRGKSRLLSGISRIIDAKADDVRLYPVPPGAAVDVTGPDLLPEDVLYCDRLDAVRRTDSTRSARDGSVR